MFSLRDLRTVATLQVNMFKGEVSGFYEGLI